MHLHIYSYVLFTVLYELDKIVKIRGNIGTTTKFSRLKSIPKSIPTIEDNYAFTLVIYLFSDVSLQSQRETIMLYCDENVHRNWVFKKSEFFKGF